MKVELEHNLTTLGNIITIIKDGEPCARLRQIGRHHPDTRLEWLTWTNGKMTQNAIQFPFAHLADITISDAEKLVTKYNI